MFWEKLAFPIVGLSPMDGVTDAPMRFVAKKYGKPAVIYTEFVSAEGLWRLKKKGEYENRIWKDLIFDESERPVIAQLFGSDPEAFYESAKIIKELGFDGIDINMGCPSPGLEKREGGAGLIRSKERARLVIEAARRGAGGLPVSVKTRLGSKEVDPTWWEFLASMKLPAVAMHGRTFKQLYSGEADWESLTKAAEVIRASGAKFLGNGDVRRVTRCNGDTGERIVVELKNGGELDLTGKMDGVLIGREAIGDPWVLNGNEMTDPVIKMGVAVEHARKFEEVFPGMKFFPMRKHLVKYVQGFEGASDLRKQMVLANCALEVEKLANQES